MGVLSERGVQWLWEVRLGDLWRTAHPQLYLLLSSPLNYARIYYFLGLSALQAIVKEVEKVSRAVSDPASLAITFKFDAFQRCSSVPDVVVPQRMRESENNEQKDKRYSLGPNVNVPQRMRESENNEQNDKR
ncbi:hypothetical protein NDU88_007593 [Pleurodeles waltl]|uniref:Uncharacterized protein n=1 Tax=Pleurodeles waltl TaxID=8319 RepID=A0AAV7QQB1_PLEWA|nr:hypothetical protein NDU88_007593 [Pleurodeles waltl]